MIRQKNQYLIEKIDRIANTDLSWNYLAFDGSPASVLNMIIAGSLPGYRPSIVAYKNHDIAVKIKNKYNFNLKIYDLNSNKDRLEYEDLAEESVHNQYILPYTGDKLLLNIVYPEAPWNSFITDMTGYEAYLFCMDYNLPFDNSYDQSIIYHRFFLEFLDKGIAAFDSLETNPEYSELKDNLQSEWVSNNIDFYFRHQMVKKGIVVNN